MNAISLRVFNTLSTESKAAFEKSRAAESENLDDLLQQLALAELEHRTSDYARSATRRFREGGRAPRMTVALDAERDEYADAFAFSPEDYCEDEEIEYPLDFRVDIAEISSKFGVTSRRAYQIVQSQIERASSNFDLFAGA